MKKKVFGSVDIQGKEALIPSLPYDRIAIGNQGHLYLLSLIAEDQRIKAIRALFTGKAGRVLVTAAGGKVRKPSDPEWRGESNPGNLTITEGGYACYKHKLGYGQSHALFVTREQGFLPVVSEESLWQELNDVRFTTPILRAWMPYIEAQLREQELLDDARVFNCRCGFLTAHTGNLDEIVESGLKAGDILIPRSAAA